MFSQLPASRCLTVKSLLYGKFGNMQLKNHITAFALIMLAFLQAKKLIYLKSDLNNDSDSETTYNSVYFSVYTFASA